MNNLPNAVLTCQFHVEKQQLDMWVSLSLSCFQFYPLFLPEFSQNFYPILLIYSPVITYYSYIDLWNFNVSGVMISTVHIVADEISENKIDVISL